MEACDRCGGGSSMPVCVERTSIQAVAYNLTNGNIVAQGGSISTSDLVIDANASITEETCMLHAFNGGALMACSPAAPYYYKFDLEVEEIRIVSDAMIAQGYPAGSNLNSLLETVRIETPEAGTPIELNYNESFSAFLFYIAAANQVPPDYDDNYYKSFSREVLRFKEDVDINKGPHSLTIEWMLSDDSIMSSSIDIVIE